MIMVKFAGRRPIAWLGEALDYIALSRLDATQISSDFLGCEAGR